MGEYFLIQSEHGRSLKDGARCSSSDVAAFIERLDEENWLHPERAAEGCLASYDEVIGGGFQPEFLQRVVPVGSIEFVEAVLQRAYGISGIRPLNVPDKLKGRAFWGRRMAIVQGREEFLHCMQEWQKEALFLKSADRVKCDFTGIYAKEDTFPLDADRILLSEPIDIRTEWRIFVFREKIVDVRWYRGDPWTVPSLGVVRRIVARFRGSLTAYTLDVAVCGNQQTVIIELHRFLCCGLYGAELPVAMYSQAYWEEVRQHPGVGP